MSLLQIVGYSLFLLNIVLWCLSFTKKQNISVLQQVDSRFRGNDEICKKRLIGKIILGLIVALLINICPIVNKLSLVAIMNGAFSDLSITSILILAIVMWENLHNIDITVPTSLQGHEATMLPEENFNFSRVQQIFSRPVQLVIILLGASLYLSVIGFIKFDIYDLGYEPTYLIVGFVLLELLFLKINKLFAGVWLAALIGFYFNLQNSLNLWDYILDPFLWLYTLYSLFITK